MIKVIPTSLLLLIKNNKRLFFMILLYILVLGTYSCMRHRWYYSQAYDLAIFEQSIWNTIHGNMMYNTFEMNNHLAVHMSPILFLLVPFYFVFRTPYTLIILQTVMLSLGAIPLYFLAKKLFDKRTGLVFAFAYLMYHSVHNINRFDFHPVSFAVPFLLFALYYIETDRLKPAGVFLFLAAMCKENVVLAVLFVGLYAIIFKKKHLFGILVSVLSLGWFLLSVKVIMPALGGDVFVAAEKYEQFGDNAIEIIKNIILNPRIVIVTIFKEAKLRYLFWLFSPVFFLPLFYMPGLFLLIPGLAQNLLTDSSDLYSSLFQYDSILIPFIFMGSILSLNNLINDKKNLKWWRLVIITATLVSFVYRSPIGPLDYHFSPEKHDISRPVLKEFNGFLKTIPRDASVTASLFIVPHLSKRREIYLLVAEQELTDYVILDSKNCFEEGLARMQTNALLYYKDTGLYEEQLLGHRFIILTKTGNFNVEQ